MPPRTRRGAQRGAQRGAVAGGARGRGRGRGRVATRASSRNKAPAQPTFIEIDSIESSEEECIDDISSVIDVSELTVLDEVTDNSVDEEPGEEPDERVTETEVVVSVKETPKAKGPEKVVTQAKVVTRGEFKKVLPSELENGSTKDTDPEGTDVHPGPNEECNEKGDNKDQEEAPEDCEAHDENGDRENDEGPQEDSELVTLDEEDKVEEEEEEEEYIEQEVIEEEEVEEVEEYEEVEEVEEVEELEEEEEEEETAEPLQEEKDSAQSDQKVPEEVKPLVEVVKSEPVKQAHNGNVSKVEKNKAVTENKEIGEGKGNLKNHSNLKTKSKDPAEDSKKDIQDKKQQPNVGDATKTKQEKQQPLCKEDKQNIGESTKKQDDKKPELKVEQLEKGKEIVTKEANKQAAADSEQELTESLKQQVVEEVEGEEEAEEEEEEELVEEEEELVEEEEEVEYIEEEEEILEEEEEEIVEEEEVIEDDEVLEGDEKNDTPKGTEGESIITGEVAKENRNSVQSKETPVVAQKTDTATHKELNVVKAKDEAVKEESVVSKQTKEEENTPESTAQATEGTEELNEDLDDDDDGEMEVLEEATGDELEEQEEYEEEYIEVEGDEEVEYEEVEVEEEEEEIEYEEYEEVEEEEIEQEEKEPEETVSEVKPQEVEQKKDEEKENQKEKETEKKEIINKELEEKKDILKEQRKKLLEEKILLSKQNKLKADVKLSVVKKKREAKGDENDPVLIAESSDEEGDSKTKDSPMLLKRKGPSTIEINIKTSSFDKPKPPAKKLPLKGLQNLKDSSEKPEEKKSSTSPKPAKDVVLKTDKKSSESVKKNLNALEEIMKSDDWKDTENDATKSKPFPFKKPFIKGVQEGRPAVFEIILGAKEPLLGLEYIVEVWKEDGKTAPRYFCALCIYLLTHEELLKHLNHVSHKGAYLNLHARECWGMFPKAQPSKWSHEYVIALEKVCQLMEENNMRRLNMLITCKRTYDMYLGRIHHQADQLPHYQLPDSWRQIFKDLNLPDARRTEDSRDEMKEKRDPASSRPGSRLPRLQRFSYKDKRTTPPRRSRTPEKRRHSRSRSRSPFKKSRYYSPYAKKRKSRSISPFRKGPRVKRSKSPSDLYRSSKKRYRSRSRSPRRRSQSRSRSRSRSGSYSRKRRSRSNSRPRRRHTRSRSRSQSPTRHSFLKRKESFGIGELHMENRTSSSVGSKATFLPGTFKKTIKQSTTSEAPRKTFNPLVSLSSSSIEENIFKTLQNFMKPSEPVRQSNTMLPLSLGDVSANPNTVRNISVLEKPVQIYKQNTLRNPENPNYQFTAVSSGSYSVNPEKRGLADSKLAIESSNKIESLISNRGMKTVPTRAPSHNLRAIPERIEKQHAVGEEKRKPSISSSLMAIKQLYSNDDRDSFANPSRPEKGSNLYPPKPTLRTPDKPNVTFPAARGIMSKAPDKPNVTFPAARGIMSKAPADNIPKTLGNVMPRAGIKAQMGTLSRDGKSKLMPYQINEETKKEFMDFMCKIQTAPTITPKAEEKTRPGIFATTKKTVQDAENWLKSLASGAQAACSNTMTKTSVTKKGAAMKTKKVTNFWDSWMERHDEREEPPAAPSPAPAAKENLERKGYTVNAFENFKNITALNRSVEGTAINRPVERTAVNRPVERTAVNRPVERTSVNRPVERTAVNRPVERTAVNRPVERTAVNRPVERIASNRPVDRSAMNRPVESRTLGYEKTYQTHHEQEDTASQYSDTFGKQRIASSHSRTQHMDVYEQSPTEDIDPEEWLYKQEQLAWAEQEGNDYEEVSSHSWEQPQPQVMIPAPMPTPQEDVTSVAEKLNSTLTRILKDYKPTGGLFSTPKLIEPPPPQPSVIQERNYQQMSLPSVSSTPVPSVPSNNINMAGTIAATLTKMGLTNVTQDQLVNIVKNLGLLPSGNLDVSAMNLSMGNTMEPANTYEQEYRYQHF